MAKNKTRLDVALVEKGLAESREKARRMQMASDNASMDLLIKCLCRGRATGKEHRHERAYRQTAGFE